MTLSLFLVMNFAGCGRQQEDQARETAATEEKAATDETSAEETKTPEPSMAPITEERTYYDFEGDLRGWEIPMWARDKRDYVAEEVSISEEVSSKGNRSMKIDASFPGGMWYAALAEIQQYLDMSRYRVIRADIYLPPDAPEGLKAKLILTVGDSWKFVEMSGSIPLMPGKWMTISANIEPGSYDWKRVVPDEQFAQDVRKIAIRIVSNKKPVYTGPIYIDNIRVGR
jgi:hypothetical protein